MRGLRSWASVAWFLVPALVLFLVFVLAPIAVAVYTGFFKWGGTGPMDDFVGFENYAKLFADQVFLGDLGRGLYLVVLSITVQLPFALFTAVLLNQRLRGRAVYRMLFFAPYILSEVVTAVLFTMIFLPGAGMADHLVGALGLDGLQGKWLADPSTVMPTLFAVMTWKYFGFHMMLFLAGLQSIPG
ncbi:sugar ABC transporter permease, partial [Streptomyces sp. NPDC002812]|uniref:carbohydrate ABC transporter permease n=1 Tax=Streptomyces sp. NPDC002812 TaxID=3154434 RepID=UPI00332C8A00